MSSLNKLSEKFLEPILAMPPTTRLMALLLGLVVVASLIWTLSIYDASSQSQILGELTQEELRRAEQAFAAKGLSEFQIAGSRISVPTREKSKYIQALSEGNAMPTEWGQEMKESLSESFFESETTRRARFEIARERSFEETLTLRPQIESARVDYDEARGGFSSDTVKTCAISVCGAGGQPVDRVVLKSIAHSAMTTFAGLTLENITVTDVNTSLAYSGNNEVNTVENNPLLLAQAEWEEHYLQKASQVLSQYGAVRINVTVSLDPTMTQRTERHRYEPDSAQTETVSSRRLVVSTHPSDQQLRSEQHRTGQVSFSLASDAPGGFNQPKSVTRTETTEETKRSQLGHEISVTSVAGLVPQSVAISIGIPKSYYHRKFVRDWKLANPFQKQELASLPNERSLLAMQQEVKASIRAALPDAQINVYSFTDFPIAEIPTPTFGEKTATWLSQSWATCALVGVVLLCLFSMSSWIRSSSTPFAVRASSVRESEMKSVDDVQTDRSWELNQSNHQEDAAADGATVQNPQETAASDLGQDLSKLVKDNPEATRNLLKHWIGEAA